jgi:hypothetical protein
MTRTLIAMAAVLVLAFALAIATVIAARAALRGSTFNKMTPICSPADFQGGLCL